MQCNSLLSHILEKVSNTKCGQNTWFLCSLSSVKLKGAWIILTHLMFLYCLVMRDFVNIINHSKSDYKSWGMWEKGIVCLRSFCVVLRSWVFIKSRKGKKWGVFVVWCWGCFGAILYKV